jgi:hypothetical protein
VLTTKYEFIYPTNATIALNEDIYIGCPLGALQHNKVNITEGFFTCKGKTTFESKSSPTTSIDFNMITCPNMTKSPDYLIPLKINDVASKSKDCLKCASCKEKNIGYELPDKTFINIITVCFDTTRNIPLFSKHKLSKDLTGKGLDRPSFQDTSSTYKGYDLKKLYSSAQEQIDLKGSFNITSNIYLNRGHLTPFGDFVYRFQKYATMDFLNIAPQWTTFNAVAWENLETKVRNMTKSSDFDVFTGTLESLNSLTDGNSDHKITIPNWFWKFVPQLKTVYLGLNNVFINSTEAEKQAKSLCTKMIQLNNTVLPNISADQPNNGFTFPCTVPNVRHRQLRALMKTILSTSSKSIKSKYMPIL